MSLPHLIGHRGRSSHRPENTLAAFRAALLDAPPADGVELDVLLTADGHPVVFHDDHLLRLTGLDARVDDLDLDQLGPLRVAAEPIPTLADVVATMVELAAQRAARTILNVELKAVRDPAALLAACSPLLSALAATRHVELVLSSFDPRIVFLALQQGVPGRTAYLYDNLQALTALPLLDDAGAVDLHPRYDLVTSAHLADHAQPDRRFRVWTVDDPAEATRLAELGVDAIICNDPQSLRRAMAPGSTPA